MPLNRFNRIAPVYDRLATLVYGSSIRKAQVYFLNQIPDNAQVLILGGGSGWILQELFCKKPHVQVCYIEAASAMLAYAKIKADKQRVQFIHGTENDIPPGELYDVVITNFYLDLFSDESLRRVLQTIQPQLKKNSMWLATDFVNQIWWHKLMLKVMYTFFRAVSNIGNNKLPDWNKVMLEMGGRKRGSMFFYGNFIETTVFQFL
ncbi:MAG: class I SAM-dependent methyltransferase [Bacteroidetes bacterium]|nr:class I SAM-dependent methyltransferase [Bacteroidota bacterium]